MDKVIVSEKIVLGNHFSQVQNFRRGRLMEPNMKKKYLTQQILLWVWRKNWLIILFFLPVCTYL